MFKICFMAVFFLTGGNITTQGFFHVHIFKLTIHHQGIRMIQKNLMKCNVWNTNYSYKLSQQKDSEL